MSHRRILVVDDEGAVRRSVSRALESSGYSCTSVGSIEHARSSLRKEEIDLVICDLMMPDVAGLDLVRELEDGAPRIPVLVISGIDDPAIAHQAALAGADGYLVKPFTVNELRINVDRCLEEGRRRAATVNREREQEERIEEVRAAMRQLEDHARATDNQAADLLRPLSEAVGRRDLETGAHIRRIGEAAGILAGAFGMTEDEVESMRMAAPMHDVGKVAVPDSVLLKPGRLEPQERALMERHSQIGHDILTGSASPLLDLAAEIALTHHERYDGTGYPQGLQGDEIPLSGRIVAIVDVFDALTSDRPYRKAMAVDRALEIMKDGRGKHFDPELLDPFFDELDRIIDLSRKFADEQENDHDEIDQAGGQGPDEQVLAARRKEVDIEKTLESYVMALRTGDEQKAAIVASEHLRAGADVAALYANIVGPAMWQIGDLWARGTIEVPEERIASEITYRVMASAFESSPQAGARNEKVLLAAVPGQRHSMGLRMVADLLALAGFRTVFLGADLSDDGIVSMVDSHEPELVCLSWTLPARKAPGSALVARLGTEFPGMPILAGGQRVPEEILQRDRVRSVDELRELTDVVEELISTN